MATPADLPRAVTAFLKTHVGDMVQLKFLLTMHSAPGAVMTISMMSRTLDVPATQARELAADAMRRGLVRVTGEQIELTPKSIADRLALADVAHWYGRDRIVIHDALRALGASGL
jgi:hypothetical protein